MIEGLEKALEIVKKEKEFAIQVNTQMAFGMAQIEMRLEQEMNNIKK